MEVIALINQKGGVGKTTSAANIAAGLTLLGQRVLVIDLDPQAQLCHSLGIQAHKLEYTIYDILKGEIGPARVFVQKELAAKITRARTDGDGKQKWQTAKLFITVLPSNLVLSKVDMEFADVPGKEFLLKNAIKKVGDEFDYVLIDCPPSLGLLTVNALTAASTVHIPVQSEYLALESISKLMETIGRVKAHLNSKLGVGGIIATRFDKRKLLNREVVSKLEQHFGEVVFRTRIRENIVLAEAPSHGVDIFTYRPRSYGAEDYLSLCQEILRRSARHVA